MYRIDELDNGALENFFIIYRFQLAFALVAIAINTFIAMFAFSKDSFPPHTTIFRAITLIDVVADFSYFVDAFFALLYQNKNLENWSYDSKSPQLYHQFQRTNSNNQPSLLTLPNNSSNFTQYNFPQYISIGECGTMKPYLFLMLIGRQWRSIIILLMGFERLLFVIYSLWFNSIRVRRSPIIVSTLFFATLSAGIAYTNSFFVAPEELTYFTCELTWSFGDTYGWVQSFFVIIPQLLGVFFNLYAEWFTSRNSAIFHFGSNRGKLTSERRKIRKARLIIMSNTIFCCLPQIALVILRVLSRWNLQIYKLLVSQIFLAKCFANIYIYRVAHRHRRGIFYMAKIWMKQRNKRRIDSNNSVSSVSHNINPIFT